MKISCENINNSYQNLKVDEDAFMKDFEDFCDIPIHDSDNFKTEMSSMKNRYEELLIQKNLFLNEIMDGDAFWARKYLAKKLNLTFGEGVFCKFVGPFHDGLARVTLDRWSETWYQLTDILGNCGNYFDQLSYQNFCWWFSKRTLSNDNYSTIISYYGLINKDGSYLLPPSEEEISGSSLYNGHLLKNDDDGDLYFLNENGLCGSKNFADVMAVGIDDIAIVSDSSAEGDWYYFDLQNQKPLFADEKLFYECSSFDSGIAMVKDSNNLPSYYIDKAGERLFPDKNFEAHSSFRNGRAVVKDGNGYFCIDINGEAVWGERRFKNPITINRHHVAIIEKNFMMDVDLDKEDFEDDDYFHRSPDNDPPWNSLFVLLDKNGESLDNGSYTSAEINNDCESIIIVKHSYDEKPRWANLILCQEEGFVDFSFPGHGYHYCTVHEDLIQLDDSSTYINFKGEVVFDDDSK